MLTSKYLKLQILCRRIFKLLYWTLTLQLPWKLIKYKKNKILLAAAEEAAQKEATAKKEEADKNAINDMLINKYIRVPFFNTLRIDHAVRINLLLPILDELHLYAGITTALLFAINLANKNKVSLRIICFDSIPDVNLLAKIAQIHDVSLPEDYEICQLGYRNKAMVEEQKLLISKNDIFIGTFWWTAIVAKKLSIKNQYMWLIQDYEKIFYPNGDEQVLIDRLLNDANMLPIVNSKILYDFYAEYGYEHIKKNALVFEPAFPHAKNRLITADPTVKSKYNLFFYSRPNIPRNLFYIGLDLIDTAIKLDIINPAEWNIYFVGQESETLRFNTVEAINLGKLTWDEYYSFLKDIDLGICLMYAPCPSYPPLDLASLGGAVLTNHYKNKITLQQYSQNIITSELEPDLLLENLKKAIAIAKDSKNRFENYKLNCISNDWQSAFSKTIEKIDYVLSDEMQPE